MRNVTRTALILAVAASAGCQTKAAGPSEPTADVDSGGHVATDTGPASPGTDTGPSSIDATLAGDAPATADGGGEVAMMEEGITFTSSAPRFVVAGSAFRYAPSVLAEAGVDYRLVDAPEGLELDEDGVMRWSPVDGDEGVYSITIEATSGAFTAIQAFELTVSVPALQATETILADRVTALVVDAPLSPIQGAGIQIPAGALSSETEMTISALATPPEMPGLETAVRAVEFGPSGLVFDSPVTIALPFTAGMVSSEAEMGAFVFNEESGNWDPIQVVSVDLANGVLLATTSHFSTYAAAPYVAALGGDCAANDDGHLRCRQQWSDSFADIDASLMDSDRPDAFETGHTLAEYCGNGDFRGSTLFARADIESRLINADGSPGALVDSYVSTAAAEFGAGEARLYRSDDARALVDGNVPVRRFATVDSCPEALEQMLRGMGSVRDIVPGVTVASGSSLSVRARWSLFLKSGENLGRTPPRQVPVGSRGVAGDYSVEVGEASLDADFDGTHDGFDLSDDRSMPRAQWVTQTTTVYAGDPVDLVAELEDALDATEDGTFDVTTGITLGDRTESTSGGRYALHFVPATPGRVAVRLTVRTWSETDIVMELVVRVVARPVQNTPPSCRITREGGGRVGEPVRLVLNLTDAEQPVISLRATVGLYDSESASLVSSALLTSRGSSAMLIPAAEGSYDVACIANDGVVDGSLSHLVVDVLPLDTNLAPLLGLPPSVSAELDRDVVIRAFGSDPDRDTLTYHFSVGGVDVDHSTNATGASTTYRTTAAGSFDITVSVTDGRDGHTVTARSTLTVSAPDASRVDADRDGFPAGLDCDDTNAGVNPSARDICGNGVDEDCRDGSLDSDCDRDGYTTEQGDADDGDPRRNPGARELCDGVDNNNDGSVDAEFGIGQSCSVGAGACAVRGVMQCSRDQLFAVCAGVMSAPSVEVCDGADNDCDGQVDEDAGETYFFDGDRDGHGTAAQKVRACRAPEGFVSQADDCDDRNATRSPSASEDCRDTVDNDCDREINEGCAAAGTACTPSTEVCDGADNNCDGQVDEQVGSTFYFDGDGDGFGQSVRTATACSKPDRFADNALDCDDSSRESNPEAAERCDGRDNNCDGVVDEECPPTGDGTMTGGSASLADEAKIIGTWMICADATCTTLAPHGFTIRSDHTAASMVQPTGLDTLDLLQPICEEGDGRWNLSADTRTLTYTTPNKTESFSVVVIDDRMTAVDPAGVVHTLARISIENVGKCSAQPGCEAVEACGDAADNDCDGTVDEECGPPGTGPDCRDIGPEVCGDRLDNDCSGIADDGCDPSGTGAGETRRCADVYGSECGAPFAGVCSRGVVECSSDDPSTWRCRPLIQPGEVAETCDNFSDDDCDGEADDKDTDCGGAPPPSAYEICADGADNDRDGYVDEEDCLPPATGGPVLTGPEYCGDGMDNDRDGYVDEEDCLPPYTGSGTTGPEYCGDGMDNDRDGYVDEEDCLPPDTGSGTTGPEYCGDGMDNDRDGYVDEEDCLPPYTGSAAGGAAGTAVEYCGDRVDNDSDGYVDEEDCLPPVAG